MTVRSERILFTVVDLVTAFLWDDRKEDEDLPRGEIEAAITTGEITAEQIITQFSVTLEMKLPAPPVTGEPCP